MITDYVRIDYKMNQADSFCSHFFLEISCSISGFHRFVYAEYKIQCPGMAEISHSYFFIKKYLLSTQFGTVYAID